MNIQQLEFLDGNSSTAVATLRVAFFVLLRRAGGRAVITWDDLGALDEGGTVSCEVNIKEGTITFETGAPAPKALQ